MNLVKEFLLLKAKVDKLYCQLIAKSPDEQDPTVPNHVKTIKQEDIDNWNKVEDIEVQITEATNFAQIGQTQKDFNKNISDKFNEKLDKGTYTGTAQDLKNSIDGKANTSHTHNISDITNLQTALGGKLDKGGYEGTAQDLKNDIETKQKKLSSFNESILIESDGNIEGNVSLFTEYFQQQVCELNFIPTQIIGVYQDGIKLLPEEFNITLPKTITIKTYSTEKIEIQYTHLKNN